jgi:hypothetical protein
MAFCPNCGKEISSNSAFCSSCGSNLKDTKKGSPPTSSQKKVTTTEKTGLGALDVKTYMIISTAGLGAVALLAIMMRDSVGFILCAALCAALYFLGVKKLEEGDSATAKRTSLIVGIIGGVIGLAMLLYSQFTGAIVILVVIPALLAWYKLEQKS